MAPNPKPKCPAAAGGNLDTAICCFFCPTPVLSSTTSTTVILDRSHGHQQFWRSGSIVALPGAVPPRCCCYCHSPRGPWHLAAAAVVLQVAAAAGLEVVELAAAAAPAPRASAHCGLEVVELAAAKVLGRDGVLGPLHAAREASAVVQVAGTSRRAARTASMREQASGVEEAAPACMGDRANECAACPDMATANRRAGGRCVPVRACMATCSEGATTAMRT